jgi:hypothetical protein
MAAPMRFGDLASLENALKMPTTTNRGARTSGAAKLFMVVPAPELLRVNVAVRG